MLYPVVTNNIPPLVDYSEHLSSVFVLYNLIHGTAFMDARSDLAPLRCVPAHVDLAGGGIAIPIPGLPVRTISWVSGWR
jgi:hypothetical protein